LRGRLGGLRRQQAGGGGGAQGEGEVEGEEARLGQARASEERRQAPGRAGARDRARRGGAALAGGRARRSRSVGLADRLAARVAAPCRGQAPRGAAHGGVGGGGQRVARAALNALRADAALPAAAA